MKSIFNGTVRSQLPDIEDGGISNHRGIGDNGGRKVTGVPQRHEGTTNLLNNRGIRGWGINE